MFPLILAAAIAAAPPSTQASSPPACIAATQFTGTVCAAQTAGKHPAILLLGGSEGGDALKAALPPFASAGYVAVSVAYFGAPGLPDILNEIPVETVGKALAAVAKRDDVDPERIAIMGVSKGGELALLAATLYPSIHAVVAVVASPFAWAGIPRGPEPVGSSWTIAGKPIPYVPYGPEMGAAAMKAFASRAPLDMRPAYDASLAHSPSSANAATFALEKIAGPVLFLAADDDRIWNSPAQSEFGMTYLRDHHHAFADQYIHYANAGHLFLFVTPDRPMNTVPLGPVTFLMGGTPQGDLAAEAAAWPNIFGFLEAALRRS